MTDTIFAQASAKGRAGVAVIRISGPRAFSALEALTGPRPGDRVAALRSVRSADGELIDQALALCFPAPGSFTGEDVAELQVHGGPAVCAAVLDLIDRQEGTRPATAGEFTRRALLNGKLDLAQVEGLGDLLAAETEAQRRQAARLTSGALSGQAARWREKLIRALAFIEASIDFVDDEIPADVLAGVEVDLSDLAEDLARAHEGAALSERLREGFEVALVGAPNVGKSTLLNALARRDVAITSPRAGTTRDVIEVRTDLGGLPVTWLDMAGLRRGGGEIEQIGMGLARKRAAAADMRLFLSDRRGETTAYGVDKEPGDLVVRMKRDLGGTEGELAVSGLTGEGIPELIGKVGEELGRRADRASGISHRRQGRAVAAAHKAVAEAILLLRREQPEVASDELRRAARALDFLVGKVDVEAVLDAVFLNFCLGK